MKDVEDVELTAQEICAVLVDSDGVSEMCSFILAESTRCSPSVVQVINNLESIAFKWRTNRKVQALRVWSEEALWFGWRGTVKWPDHNPVFGTPPAWLPKAFILRVIEIGTSIAVRQLKH